MSDLLKDNRNEVFDGAHTLTEADLKAIRTEVFKTVPIEFMDTQKIVIENKRLRAERDRLRGWVAMLVDKVKEDTGIFGSLSVDDVTKANGS